MSRIITNVPSLLAQRVLGNNNRSLTTTLERLSTGYRINRGKDDPAGLIASENLRAEKVAISAAIGNAERADQVISIADGGLAEISTILTEIESLVVQTANDAGLSQEEKDANQLQIDSLLNSIDRIASQTTFQGSKLLNGTFSYVTSGVDSSRLTDVQVDAAKIPSTGSLALDINTLVSAQHAVAYLDVTASAGAARVSGTTLGIEVAGNDGILNFQFASGTLASSMVTSINNFAEVTGISATVSNNIITFTSRAYGSNEFVSVGKISGATAYDTRVNDTPTGTGEQRIKDFGRNATVDINGIAAQVNGLEARVTSPILDVTVLLDETTMNTVGATTNFSINGGGANFQFSPRVDLAGRVSVGIDSVSTGRLGSNESGRLFEIGAGGSANVVTGDRIRAQNILSDAIKDVTLLRGRLGSIQKDIIAPSIRSLGITLENTAAAESAIRDTDFAEETSNLTRNQILVQAASASLALANSAPQNVLQLLG